MIMQNNTISFNAVAKGWVSFYSYYPDYMIGMNNFFYTFKGGDLYRHNVNSNRNTFYTSWWDKIEAPEGAFTPAKIESVFNIAPVENKLFKTIKLEGNKKWAVTLKTNLQESGFIEEDWFKEKESSFFAFIRNNSNGELKLRSVNGIGKSHSVIDGEIINFIISISIGDIISVGDLLYFSLPPYTSPVLAGKITSIYVDIPNNMNQLTIDTSISGAIPIPIQDAFFLYIKNSIGESHGLLGHYCLFNLENNSKDNAELFAVQTEIMKSFP